MPPVKTMDQSHIFNMVTEEDRIIDPPPPPTATSCDKSGSSSENDSENRANNEEPSLHQSLIQFNQLMSLFNSPNHSDILIALNRTSNMVDSHALHITVTLVPVMCLNVTRWTEDIQAAAGRLIARLLNPEILQCTTLHVLSTAVDVLHTCSSESTFFVWTDVLIASIPLSDLPNHPTHVHAAIGIVERFSAHSYLVYRKQAARILLPLANVLPASVLAEMLVPILINLLCDDESPVQNIAVDSCSPFLTTLHHHDAEAKIWPRVANILQEADVRVQVTAFRAFSKAVKASQRDQASIVNKSYVPTIFNAECKLAAKWDFSSPRRRISFDTCALMRVFAEEFGPLTHALYNELTNAQRDNVVAAYCNIAKFKKPIVRRACTFNYPAICFHFGDRFSTRLGVLAENWVLDEDVQTRLNMATCLQPTFKYMHSRNGRESLVKAYRHLLSDDNANIKMKAMNGLYDMFNEISANATSKEQTSRLMGSIFHSLHSSTGDVPWRVQIYILNDINRTMEAFPVPILTSHVLPFLKDVAGGSGHIVRRGAMAVVASTLWRFPPGELRDIETAQFVLDWAQAQTYWKRICFIECARAALHLFDVDAFRKHFLSNVLHLSLDKISNVRLRLARFMSELAQYFQVEASFRSAAILLSLDQDSDVREVLFKQMGRGFWSRITQKLVGVDPDRWDSAEPATGEGLYNSECSVSNTVKDVHGDCIDVITKPEDSCNVKGNAEHADVERDDGAAKMDKNGTYGHTKNYVPWEEIEIETDRMPQREGTSMENSEIRNANANCDERSSGIEDDSSTQKQKTDLDTIEKFRNVDAVQYVDEMVDLFLSEEESDREVVLTEMKGSNAGSCRVESKCDVPSTDVEKKCCTNTSDVTLKSDISSNVDESSAAFKGGGETVGQVCHPSGDEKIDCVLCEAVEKQDRNPESREWIPKSPVSVVVDKVAKVKSVSHVEMVM